MSLIVKTVTRLTVYFILLYGIYITISGHVSPGGGFAGGVIIALAFIQVMLAFGKEVALKRLRTYALRFWVCIAALAFLFSVIFNLASPYRQILEPFFEMTIVGLSIFAIFIGLVFMSKQDKNSE